MTERRPPPPLPPRLETYRPTREPVGDGNPQLKRREPQFAADGTQRQRVPATGRPSQPSPSTGRSDRRNAKSRSGRGFIGSILSLGVMVILTAALAAFAVTLLPADLVRDRVIALIKERTGRDLIIRGPASVSIYPNVAVSMADAELSAPPAMSGGKPFATMQKLEVSVSLLPLLRRQVVINTLTLDKPVFHLEVDQSGQKTWDFTGLIGKPNRIQLADARREVAAGEPVSDAADATLPSAPKGSLLGGNIEQVYLGDVRIVDGTVRYRNARDAVAQDVSNLNVRFSLPAIASTLAAKGDVVWRGKKISFDGGLTSLAAVIEQRPAKINLALLAGGAEGTFEGTASFGDTLAAEGILGAKTASARDLARWLGVTLPPSQGFGPLDAKGILRISPNQTTYQTVEIKLDDLTAHGQIVVETASARPYVKANLKLNQLNLNTYASNEDAGAANADAQVPPAVEATEPANSPSPPADAPAATSIDDLLARDAAAPGPRVKGYTQRAGWSEEPYQFAALSAFDADAKLSIGKLMVRDIKAGQTELTLALKNRVLRTAIDDMMLYEGRGRGFISVDATAPQIANLVANLTFEGISARPLLKDASDFDRIAGKGRLAIALAGQGQNERQIVETLSGKADFTFKDGSVSGVNVEGLIRAASEGRFGDIKTAPSDKTNFSELAASFAVAQGVARTQDVRLISPLLRVSAAGTISLPPRELDLLARPRIVASLDGQGAQSAEQGGLEIPVRIHGSWDSPKYTPDLNGVLGDPNKAIDTVKEIGKQLKGKNANEIVDNLLGKGGKGDGSNTKAKNLLKNLFGGQQ